MIALLDTHQHLLYRDRLAYPWADALPPLATGDFSVGDYHGLTAERGVAASIFMEVNAQDYQAETRFVAGLAADPDNRILGLIASCRPEAEAGFGAWLDECADMPVIGFRRILHEAPDALSQDDTFRRNIREIGRRGHVFDMVYRADQLDIAADLARACDDMPLMLDHCGVPDIAGGEFANWRAKITALAALPNVSCKLSGILAYCAPGQATLDTVRPYAEHVIDSFGPDRLVWGSDWPVVNLKSDLPQWIDIFRALIEGLSEGEQARICNENAQRIYGVSL